MNETENTTKRPPYVQTASYGKEFGSFAIDLLATLAIGMTLKYTLGQMVIAPSLGYSEAKEAYFALAEESGLYESKNGSLTPVTFSGAGEEYYSKYEVYVDKIWTYYYDLCGKTSSAETNFVLTGLVNSEDATRESLAEALEVSATDIEAYKQAVGRYVYSEIFDIVEGKESEKDLYFTYPLQEDGTTPDFSLKPVLKEEVASKVNDEDDSKRLAAKIDVFNYVCAIAPTSASSASTAQNSASSSSASVSDALFTKACSDFISQPKALHYNSIGWKAGYIATIPSTVVPPLIFFFILPLCLKRGKTLGKLVLKLSVAGSDGYEAPKWSIAIHAFLVFLPFCVLLLPFNSQINYMIWGFWMLIDFIVLLFSKTQQALHGRLSKTIVVDDKLTPKIFASKEEEKKYCAENHDKITEAIREGKGITSTPKEPVYLNGRKSVVSGSEDPSMGIVDSSTIGRARQEARNMTSFDEFEASHGGVMSPEEADAHEERVKQREEASDKPQEEDEFDTSMDEEALKDPEIQAMMKMDGLEGDLKESKETEKPKEPQDPHDDGFLDEPSTPSKEEAAAPQSKEKENQ